MVEPQRAGAQAREEPDPLPALFVSHGAPTLALERSPAHEHLRALGRALHRSTTLGTLSMTCLAFA